MSAGQPDWQKLQDMGRLPQEHRDKIPGLQEVDRIKSLLCKGCLKNIYGEKQEVIEEESVTSNCEVEGCDFSTTNTPKMLERILKSHVTRAHKPNE